MSKRRNLKKEKAERNKAYARKFHKSRPGGRFSRKGGYNSSGRTQGGNNADTNKAED